eukprot:103401-Pyramimonas_sp.AAC.2
MVLRPFRAFGTQIGCRDGGSHAWVVAGSGLSSAHTCERTATMADSLRRAEVVRAAFEAKY